MARWMRAIFCTFVSSTSPAAKLILSGFPKKLTQYSCCCEAGPRSWRVGGASCRIGELGAPHTGVRTRAPPVSLRAAWRRRARLTRTARASVACARSSRSSTFSALLRRSSTFAVLINDLYFRRSWSLVTMEPSRAY